MENLVRKSLGLKATLVAVLSLLTACSLGQTNQQKSRPQAFLGGYSEYQILDVEQFGKVMIENYQFKARHRDQDTEMTVERMVKKLKQFKTVNAYANVFEKKSGGYQCIIVHQAGVSQSVLDHELGHCFKRLFLQTLKPIAPEIHQAYLGKDDYADYIGESFAEIVAATRAWHIDQDFSYLVNRLPELQGKASFLTPYKAALPLLLQLKNYLRSHKQLPQEPEAQVQYLITDFFIANVLSRNDFEAQHWWAWVR